MADHEEIEEVDEERQEEEIDKSSGEGEEEWKRYANMSLEEKRKYYRCGDDYVQLKDIETWPNYYQNNNYKFSKIQKTFKIGKPPHKVDTKINDKVSLYVGDITELEIDAIVNAANKTLLGGGGVDGCIHRAAGYTLVEECCLLNGCETGEAKITSGHRLPAKHVIHTVGPIGKNEKALKSCYKNCLNVALKNGVKTLAFCCISTGIYGYPNKDAAEVALRTTRKWLENQSNANKIDRIIFCLFLDKDIKIYESLMLKYFPPGELDTKEETKTLTQTDEDKEPEAEKVPEDEDKDKERQDEDVKEKEEQKSREDSGKLDVELETKPQQTRKSEKPNSEKEESTTKTEEIHFNEKRDEDNEKRLKKREEYQKEDLAKGTNDEEKEGSDGVVVPKPKKQKKESEPNENEEEKGQDVEMINEDSQLRQRQEIEKKEEKVAQEEDEQMEVEDSSGKQDKEVEDVVMGSKEKQVEKTEESSEKQQGSEKEPPKQFETYV